MGDWCVELLIKKKTETTLSRQALSIDRRWQSGDVITVSFLNGDKALRRKVEEFAKEWIGAGMANLHFGFRRDTTDTMVRIQLGASGNSSLVGTDCKLLTDTSSPTMQLAITPETDDGIIRRRTLHEFGHVLGLIHEHQVPDNGFDWIVENIKQDLIPPWDEEMVMENVVNPASRNETNFTSFDKDSIMVYPIPAEWNQNGLTVDWNTNLSDKDRRFVRDRYR